MLAFLSLALRLPRDLPGADSFVVLINVSDSTAEVDLSEEFPGLSDAPTVYTASIDSRFAPGYMSKLHPLFSSATN
jgi:hypothetical protein